MKVLGRFDRTEVERRLESTGLIDAIRRRGYHDIRTTLATSGMALPHIQVHGSRSGMEALLLDACLAETRVEADYFRRRGVACGDVSLLLVYWVREQDPSREFTPTRPPLPLQQHPGLGVLPIAFRVVRAMAEDIGSDGIACLPKLYHDAYIFYRTRLFLFLDGVEQGRFQRLQESLSHLPLGHASLALLDGHVRAVDGRPMVWSPDYQVCPLSDRLTRYFHSDEYAAQVSSGMNAGGFTCAAMDLLPTIAHATDGGSTPS